MSQKVFKPQNSRLAISRNTTESCGYCAQTRSEDEPPYKICGGCRSVRFCVSAFWNSHSAAVLSLSVTKYSAKSIRSYTGLCIKRSARMFRSERRWQRNFRRTLQSISLGCRSWWKTFTGRIHILSKKWWPVPLTLLKHPSASSSSICRSTLHIDLTATIIRLPLFKSHQPRSKIIQTAVLWGLIWTMFFYRWLNKLIVMTMSVKRDTWVPSSFCVNILFSRGDQPKLSSVTRSHLQHTNMADREDDIWFSYSTVANRSPSRVVLFPDILCRQGSYLPWMSTLPSSPLQTWCHGKTWLKMDMEREVIGRVESLWYPYMHYLRRYGVQADIFWSNNVHILQVNDHKHSQGVQYRDVIGQRWVQVTSNNELIPKGADVEVLYMICTAVITLSLETDEEMLTWPPSA